MIRKSIVSLFASASLLTGGVAMVAMDATPAFAASAKANSKKKIKQSNRQSNKNRTNQEAGDVEGGNAQCVGLVTVAVLGGCSTVTSGASVNGNGTLQINAAQNNANQTDTASGNAIAADN